MFNKAVTAFLVILQLGYIAGNPARESYQRTAEILTIVKRIEESLGKEERLREITDIIRIDSTIDKMSKKLDRVVSILEGGSRSSSYARSSPSTEIAEVDRPDVTEKLDGIGDRLERMESSVSNMEGMLNDGDLRKLNDIDTRSSELKEDLNKKLGKMMNVISALYEMNKDLKKNMGSRSEQVSDTPHATSTSEINNYAASQFLIENLEELERKIKEQFSILTSEIRSEITGLKIVASSVSDHCPPQDPFGDDFTSATSTGSRQSKDSKKRSSQSGSPRSESNDDPLDAIVQSLGRSTREIREEIQQGMQAIDMKLSNLTSLPLRCEDPMETSASVLQPVRVSREFQPPEQSLQDERKKEACTKNAKNVPSPKSCAELRKGGATCDGAYIIFLRNDRAVRVMCDMTTEGGGWTVLMRRGDFVDKMTSFHRNWMSYKNGFGDVEGEFWLGNDAIHVLTTQDDDILRVRLEAFDGDDVNMTYSSFTVADETDSYRMHLGPAVGKATPASNSLKYHNNHPFSTFDMKNDPFAQNCAATYKGGWWFNGCYFGFLTGEYFKPDEKRENWQGILWYDWKGNSSLKGGLMMVRPKNFTIY